MWASPEICSRVCNRPRQDTLGNTWRENFINLLHPADRSQLPANGRQTLGKNISQNVLKIEPKYSKFKEIIKSKFGGQGGFFYEISIVVVVLQHFIVLS